MKNFDQAQEDLAVETKEQAPEIKINPILTLGILIDLGIEPEDED